MAVEVVSGGGGCVVAGYFLHFCDCNGGGKFRFCRSPSL